MFLILIRRLFLIFCLVHVVSATAKDNNLIFISHAETTFVGESLAVPAADARWQAVTLPFSQAGTSSREYHWFRLVQADQLQGVQALYIQVQVFDLDIFLNGEHIGGTTRDDGLQSMGWNHPFYLEIIPSLWRKKGNDLYLRLGSGEPNAILSPLVFGDRQILKGIYEDRVFHQVKMAEWSLMACLLMGAFTLCIWFWRRSDIKYLLFSLLCFSWSVVMTYLYVPYAPIEHGLWLRFGYFCVDFSALMTLLFLNRLVGLNMPRIERALVVVTTLSGIAIALMPLHVHVQVTTLTHGVHLLFMLWVMAHVLIHAIRHRSTPAIWTSVGMLLMSLMMASDIYRMFIAYGEAERLPESTIMQYGFGVLLLIIFVYLIKTFVDALNQSEQLNAELERRVQQASVSLEQSYAENRALEMDATAQNERQRIYRDLHDDVGAKLVSIIHAQQEGNSTELAREALVSLREVVAQNSFQYRELDVLMVSCANEMELRLRNADIALSLLGIDDLPNISLPTDVGYHINRIFRELTSNIIKHAQADQVWLSCELQGALLSCELRDNGRGANADMLQGSGLNNIAYRAQEIKAQVSWENNGVGYASRLSLPLDF